MNSEKVITRFPPSPTGWLQLGNVRTALFNYFFAKQNNGTFVFRVEDTDKIRSTKESEENIVQNLAWLGLDYGGTFVRQSERSEIYKKYLEKLIADGYAYISQEKVEKEGDRPEVIRFKNPNKQITFTDLIRGEVTIDTTDLKDFVIAKSIHEPIYHLAVVADDHEGGITHIIRGEDGISNTPRQILIQEAIGAKRPIYAHLPLILAEDRSKLSKRKHGEAVSLNYYIERGYLRDAVINYMALLGWNPGTDQEIFTLEELIKIFDITKVQKGGAVFNPEKLKWINKQHIEKISKEELYEIIKGKISNKNKTEISEDQFSRLVPIILERIQVFSDIDTMIDQGELDHVFANPEYAAEMLFWKDEKDAVATKRRLEQVISLLKAVDENDFKKDIIKGSLWDYATAEGRGHVLWPTRIALSGKDKSPDPFVLAELLGKDITIKRLEQAVEKASHA